MGEFALESSAFENAQAIPTRHSCEGGDVSPPTAWSNVPEGTRSLALVVDDPDAPGGVFTHWVAGGLDPVAEGLARGSRRRARVGTTSARRATAARARRRATGATATSFACTPSYAEPELGTGTSKAELEQAIAGHVLTTTPGRAPRRGVTLCSRVDWFISQEVRGAVPHDVGVPSQQQ
jgi:hypothetical protein